MAGVLDLAQFFRLVKHGFNQGEPPQKSLNESRALNWLPVFANRGNEVYPLPAQALDQPFPIGLRASG